MAIKINNMKRPFLSLMLTLIFTNFCEVTAQNSFKSLEVISEVKNQISVGVFPQVELISIVQTISKYPTLLGFLMAKDSSEYKTDVINHFTPFKDHPAVQMFDRLSSQPRMLNFSAPSNIMLYTDKSLQLRDDIILDDFVINRIAGMDSLKVFLGLMQDFAIQSSFNEFFKDHQPYYLKIIENTVENLGPINYVHELESFYGQKQKSYNIVLVSLYNSVGFGNSLLCLNAQRELYSTIGPKSLIDNTPFFGDENILKQWIRHEFSHPFVNPLTEKYWDYIKDYSAKFDSIPEIARKNVCGDWQECINEFSIRAITTYLGQSESDEAGLRSYEREKSRGVSNLDRLLKTIDYYQSNRDAFPTLESYYLNILDVYKEE